MNEVGSRHAQGEHCPRTNNARNGATTVVPAIRTRPGSRPVPWAGCLVNGVDREASDHAGAPGGQRRRPKLRISDS